MINLGQKQEAWLMEPADIETASDDYARRFAGQVGEWMLKIQESIVLRLLRQGSTCHAKGAISTVLDVGGGHGQLAIPLCREGFAVTVVGSADSCGRRLNSMIDSGICRFQVSDLFQLPYPAKSFDAVVCFRLLTHCGRWQAILSELCRVAQTAVIIDYPTSQSLNIAAGKLFGAKKRLEGNTRTFRLFRHDEIGNEFLSHGFSVEAREGQFFLPMVLHRSLKCRRLSAWLEEKCKQRGLTQRWGSPVIVKALRANKS
ncbi:MAG: class I SAM-dependent methyltransferase [Kiritimatiellia bacterium]|nr:class I SAM-dependent methyltransferase [Kiritimatiellia bacterium]